MYTGFMTDELIRTMLRLPRDLHADLAALAKKEQRSLNAQIIYLLRKATPPAE